MTSVQSKIDIKATLALAGSVLCWGVVPLFLKYFSPYIDGWTANGYRYPIAVMFYLPVLITFHRRYPGRLRTVFRLALLPALINLAGQILWAWTPYFIDPGLMAFVVRLSTVWAVIGSFILFPDERRLLKSSLFWLGFSLAVIGFTVMTLTSDQPLTGATLYGLVIVFACSLCWAGYNLTVRRNMYAVDSRIAFGAVSLLTASGLFVLMCGLGEPTAVTRLPMHISVLIVISAFLGIAMAHVLFYVALKRVGVAIATSVNLSGAFITALLSKFLFREELTVYQWTAGCGLVIGALLLTLAQTKLHPSKLTEGEKF